MVPYVNSVTFSALTVLEQILKDNPALSETRDKYLLISAAPGYGHNILQWFKHKA